MMPSRQKLPTHRRFMGLFLKSSRMVNAYLLAATRDMNQADDLFQEVSSVLWEKFDTFEEGTAFDAWALTVARLEVLKWKQRLARSKLILSSDVLEALSETTVE